MNILLAYLYLYTDVVCCQVPGVYESALVIDTLTKEDTDKRYKVNARNEAGETVYSLSISTSPGPKGIFYNVKYSTVLC